MAKLVSKIYGEALFEAAMESGGDRAGEILEEISAVRNILAENPRFDELMKHPGIPKQEKLQVVDTVFRGRVSEELVNFLEIIVSKERYRDLPAVFDYYTDKVKEQKKIGTAYVTTALELSPSQKSAVESRLLQTSGCREMEMNFNTDASLIGGMVIRIGDRVVDSSIRTKLDSLTKQLLQIQLG
ncbi:MAG: ATP synthase F1 subunit delta [Butyrivibrio sp.]|nr:ATP synthase F1 subunit delta [Acetatifactor muris]MCM1558215.1 ATP synthase F1 subunit delta [Butyrivibrio sp.]